ncbi:MAG: TIM barrel protein [Pseudomonadota bacterium]
MKFSANLGFLWVDRPLPDRIRAAKAAGFDAVECHFPYEHPVEEIKGVCDETGLRMLGINTAPGPEECFGMAALPGREVEAIALIDQAIDYAAALGAQHINTMAGLTGGAADAEEVYRENLAYACEKAAAHGLMIVIEPLNPRAKPNYHCWRLDQAAETIKAVGADNLKIMYDFFHMQIVHGDLEATLRENIDLIGHIQFAAAHDRGEPDDGEVNFSYLFSVLNCLGYKGHLGAEYVPRYGSVEDGLGWLQQYRSA